MQLFKLLGAGVLGLLQFERGALPDLGRLDKAWSDGQAEKPARRVVAKVGPEAAQTGRS